MREGSIAFDEPVEVLRDTQRLERLFGTRFVLHRQVKGEGVSVQIDVGNEV
jgi:hypothetical protein